MVQLLIAVAVDFFCWPPCTAIPTGPNTCTEVVPSCPANFTFRTTTVGGGDFDDMLMVHEGFLCGKFSNHEGEDF